MKALWNNITSKAVLTLILGLVPFFTFGYSDIDTNQSSDNNAFSIQDDDPVVVPFPFFQDFEDPDTYTDWIIIDGAGDGFIWQVDDNDNFDLQLPMEGSFANIDSDDAGSGNDVWSILQAPVIDLSGFEGDLIEISFDHHYRHLGNSEANVMVSQDGENWETIANYTSDQGSSAGFSGPFEVTPVSESLILDGYADADFLYLQFEYNDNGAWAWYWLIDNVSVDEAPDMDLARVQIIHNSADALVEEVDIFVNGDLFLENVGFRQATPFLDVPAGVDLDLIVSPAGAGIDNGVGPITVQFDADETYVVVAAGNVSDSGYDPVVPFELFVFDAGQEEAVNPQSTDILSFHGSTDAPTVSIWETAVVEDEIIGDFSFGDFDGYTAFITDDYIIEVRDASGETTLATFEAPLDALDLQGEALVIVASGFIAPENNSDGPAFGLYVALASGGDLVELPVVEDEPDPEFARLQIIHNSADALVEEVDIFVNGDLFLEDVGFRQATPFLDVPAGVDLDLVVAPAGAGIDNGVGPITVQFDADETYVVVAAGNVSDSGYDPVEPFALYAFAAGQEEAGDPDNTDVLVFHGSTDAPTVSVWETAFVDGEIIGDFSFGDFAGYLELGTADYVLEVRDATGETTVAAFEAPLATLELEGEALVVLASGFLNPGNNSDGPAFGLYAALASGGDLMALPLQDETNVADLQEVVMNVYPNPTRGNLFIESDQEILDVRVIDILGQVVYNALGNGNNHNIDVNGKPTGMYFVQVNTSAGVVTERIQVVQ